MNQEFSAVCQQLLNRHTACLERESGNNIYKRKFVPKDRLILLGCGHISEALCRIAVMLDFSVTVVDDRGEYADPVRFPDADEVICDDFIAAIRQLHISERDYICVLTRGHRFDKECVTEILRGNMPFYLGMIGSKRKVKGVFDSLRENNFSEERISAIHAPIGLPIGSVTVNEIAVSISAELISCRNSIRINHDDSCLFQTDADMNLLQFLAFSDHPRAVVIILSSSGSTPAKSGAMMAVNLGGRVYGTIGGGCGEAQAVIKAKRLIGTGKREIIDIHMDNDAAAEEGLVCGGTIKVLIEDIVSDMESSVNEVIK